ncbi:efflux RND transporter permease subunit [Niabella sp. W65]|nr:efflux RND transporter permease subunit [Niabella sp. W65]MCH7363062.1 efflux RND transporter permease subunit [Niabella sp. W65]ULT38993.1 efflux RND transporter permease subunit [Niabella sp. I65]
MPYPGRPGSRAISNFPIERSIANIPGLEETRSISRFGLSVITVVFKDNIDIYFARQLVNEKLKQAEEAIPKGIGKPEMAPVSTGLGRYISISSTPKKAAKASITPKTCAPCKTGL